MTTKTESLKSSLIGGLPLLAALLVFAVGVATATINANRPDGTLAGEKEKGTPTLASYRAVAEKICGGPVVESTPDVQSSTVVIVMNDGGVAKVLTSYAREMFRNDIPIWPIAVCVA